MTKKFDVVIGNPPYQEDSVGDSTHNMPVYDRFMEAAYAVSRRAVLITPARFLFNTGYTPKVWNQKMLSDPHLKVSYYVPDSDSVFPGTNIMGGIVVTTRDSDVVGSPIGTFTRYPELTSILQKVSARGESPLSEIGITSDFVYRYTKKMHEDNPSAVDLMSKGNQFKIDSASFERLSFIFFSEQPSDGREYIRVLGLDGKRQRTFRWIRRDYVEGPDSLGSYKVAFPISRGHLGILGDEPALIVGYPVLMPPDSIVTGTFATVGSFATKGEAAACLNYVKSKFARVMLGILKVTQHNPAKTWQHVPLQDFTDSSEIDWTKTIPEIDQQLYAKYGLSPEEIKFIETHVKPMD